MLLGMRMNATNTHQVNQHSTQRDAKIAAPPPLPRRAGTGWQKLLRRGLHTLRHPQYQLLYCQDVPLAHASMGGEQERARRKVVRASEVFRAQAQLGT